VTLQGFGSGSYVRRWQRTLYNLSRLQQEISCSAANLESGLAQLDSTVWLGGLMSLSRRVIACSGGYSPFPLELTRFSAGTICRRQNFLLGLTRFPAAFLF